MGWLILVLFVLVIAFALWALSRFSRQSDRLLPHGQASAPIEEPGPSFSFIGGVRWKGGGSASVPMARLDISPQLIRIRGSWGPLRRLVPCWEYAISEVVSVQLSKSALGGPGLLFRMKDGNEVLFWTTEREQATAALDGVGLVVEPTDARLPFSW